MPDSQPRDRATIARENQGMLAGFDRLICDASICARTLEREYPRVGVVLPAPVEDIAVTLDRALSEGKLDGARKRTEKAVYHDPCHLGRHAKEYDAPRRVAAALFKDPPAEFPWSRDRGSCSKRVSSSRPCWNSSACRAALAVCGTVSR